MSAAYVMAGFLGGVASTVIAMGGDGRMGILFVPAVVLVVIGCAAEYQKS